MSIDQIQELKTVIMTFRVFELTQLLTFCNQSRFGRKSVLQERALELLKKENLTTSIKDKIKELYMLQRSNRSSSNLSTNTDTSNEYISTENRMTNSFNFNNHIPEYFSMPKSLNLSASNDENDMLFNRLYEQTNVNFKQIPFYDVMYCVIKPRCLIFKPNSKYQDYDCTFKLKLEEANELAMFREFSNSKYEFSSQLHLRICLLDSAEFQEDNLPSNLIVKLNSKLVPLPNLISSNKPNVESKRQSRPIDLTSLCKLSPVSKNHLFISWTSSTRKDYCFGVYLVRKLTSKDLLNKLISKGTANSTVTKKLIISKLTDTDCEISTTSLKGNLNCPLGKMRLRIPIRSHDCSHIQCFDAELYLQMNEKKPSWICPICDKKAEYSNLFIDGLFTEILKETTSDSNEIEFSVDGSWQIINNQNKTPKPCSQRRKFEEEVSSAKKCKVEEVILIDSDSEDEEVENKKENEIDSLPITKLPFYITQNATNQLITRPDSNSMTNVMNRNMGSNDSSGVYFSAPTNNRYNENSNLYRGQNSEPNVISLD